MPHPYVLCARWQVSELLESAAGKISRGPPDVPKRRGDVEEKRGEQGSPLVWRGGNLLPAADAAVGSLCRDWLFSGGRR